MKRAGSRIWQGILLFLLLCLTAMPVQAAMTKQQALNNYAKQMAKNPATDSKGVKYYFTMADVDGNGIPELIRGQMFGKENYKVRILGINGTILNKTIQYSTKILKFGYCPGENRFVVVDRTLKGQGQNLSYLYGKIVGSGVKEVLKCGRDSTSAAPYYYLEALDTGKKTIVSAAELSSLLLKEVGTVDYTSVSFYSNTASNRKKIFGTSDGKVKATTKLNRNTATIYKGQNLQLKATINGISSKVTWKSNKKSIATVNSSGKVTAKKAGKVTITAKANGVTAKCIITVKNPTIKLNNTKKKLYVDGTFQLKATVKGKSSKVTWKSGNNKIATVSSSGKVTAKKAGKVTITAKANGKTAKCTVTVRKKPVSKVSLSKAKTAMNNYIDKRYDMDTVKEYNGYISYDKTANSVYQFTFRSYTGAYAKFYVNASDGKIYMSEQNPFTQKYEDKVYVGNANNYL